MSKNNLTIPIAIVIAGIIIAGTIFYTKSSPSKKENGGDLAKEEQFSGPRPVDNSDHILGNPNAELTIVEFSDTECPFCKRFHETMIQVMEEYGKEGTVAWVYRHFPLDALHSKARKEAEATECAAETGGNEKFWEYINRLYKITPSNNGLDLNELPNIAEEIGLDKDKFEECLSSGRTAQNVEDDYQDGLKSGAKGTPYSVILTKEGKKFPVNGALPYSQLKAAIEEVLGLD